MRTIPTVWRSGRSRTSRDDPGGPDSHDARDGAARPEGVPSLFVGERGAVAAAGRRGAGSSTRLPMSFIDIRFSKDTMIASSLFHRGKDGCRWSQVFLKRRLLVPGREADRGVCLTGFWARGKFLRLWPRRGVYIAQVVCQGATSGRGLSCARRRTIRCAPRQPGRCRFWRPV